MRRDGFGRGEPGRWEDGEGRAGAERGRGGREGGRTSRQVSSESLVRGGQYSSVPAQSATDSRRISTDQST